MKKQGSTLFATVVIFLWCVLTASLLAQNENNYIVRDSFFIVKTSLDVKKDGRKPASSLSTSTDVENHCGANYIVNRTYGEMTDTYYSEYRYSDGLILEIPENEGGKVGMNSAELERIFPHSFANRKPISETKGKEGKISFIVHLAYTIDNQVHKEDAFIRFILNQNTGALEEFLTYQPL